ncbi:hypothetical protein G4B88_019705 [Cannabis sativa]|uniref:Uncharacterized protein n=1 Tax=Cannabis sativa TaxID=3483 RepID=A0A7J6HRS8_CANSA|nr:hypothetical protein G4B88_019705 [Cannabis sativa]
MENTASDSTGHDLVGKWRHKKIFICRKRGSMIQPLCRTSLSYNAPLTNCHILVLVLEIPGALQVPSPSAPPDVVHRMNQALRPQHGTFVIANSPCSDFQGFLWTA